MAKKKPDEQKVYKSLDHEIGKGLTPKVHDADLDLAKNDYADHPKLAKFKPHEVTTNDK